MSLKRFLKSAFNYKPMDIGPMETLAGETMHISLVIHRNRTTDLVMKGSLDNNKYCVLLLIYAVHLFQRKISPKFSHVYLAV